MSDNQHDFIEESPGHWLCKSDRLMLQIWAQGRELIEKCDRWIWSASLLQTGEKIVANIDGLALSFAEAKTAISRVRFTPEIWHGVVSYPHDKIGGCRLVFGDGDYLDVSPLEDSDRRYDGMSWYWHRWLPDGNAWGQLCKGFGIPTYGTSPGREEAYRAGIGFLERLEEDAKRAVFGDLKAPEPQQLNGSDPIAIWEYHEAPVELQIGMGMAEPGDDATWLAEIPPGYVGYTPAWLDVGTQFGTFNIKDHPHPTKMGWIVRVGYK